MKRPASWHERVSMLPDKPVKQGLQYGSSSGLERSNLCSSPASNHLDFLPPPEGPKALALGINTAASFLIGLDTSTFEPRKSNGLERLLRPLPARY